MARFHDEVLAPLYRPSALREVTWCHQKGLVVLLVSATFEPIASVAARRMGADGFAATRMERDARGRYTGRVDGPVVEGVEKCRAVEAWCDAHLGAGAWVLERAYADHHTDAPLLETRARGAGGVSRHDARGERAPPRVAGPGLGRLETAHTLREGGTWTSHERPTMRSA